MADFLAVDRTRTGRMSDDSLRPFHEKSVREKIIREVHPFKKMTFWVGLFCCGFPLLAMAFVDATSDI